MQTPSDTSKRCTAIHDTAEREGDARRQRSQAMRELAARLRAAGYAQAALDLENAALALDARASLQP
jgi:hypothetical protein